MRPRQHRTLWIRRIAKSKIFNQQCTCHGSSRRENGDCLGGSVVQAPLSVPAPASWDSSRDSACFEIVRAPPDRPSQRPAARGTPPW